ncbi:MAG: DUF3866 family protein [Clostridiales bacterium]|nr:DUF3866 family protein [Clostridiales bacterium]
MLELRIGRVARIISCNDQITEVFLDIDHPIKKAVNYNHITGSVSKGDYLYLNTTAGSLSLGTGGYHFVMANDSCKQHDMTTGGHGMKLRYTPFQVKVPFIEQELSDNKKDTYQLPLNLKGRLIFFGELHSMIPPLCAYFRYHSVDKLRIGYIMTDHAALPMSFSKNIALLIEKKLLDTTITIGNAFGGDYECVNIYTGLQTAAHVENCDIILISMGPGITGTGSRYGFSGLDLGFYIDLAYSLGGQCCLVPRISFADKRERHYGISHHTLTILRDITQSPIPLILPVLQKSQNKIMFWKIQRDQILSKHRVCFSDGKGIKKAMKYFQLSVSSMGRGIEADPAFFLGIGASAKKSLSSFYAKDRL